MKLVWPTGGGVSIAAPFLDWLWIGMARIVEATISQKPIESARIKPVAASAVFYVSRDLKIFNYLEPSMVGNVDHLVPPHDLSLESLRGVDWLESSLPTSLSNTLMVVDLESDRFPRFCEAVKNVSERAGVAGYLIPRLHNATWLGFSLELEVLNRTGKTAVKNSRLLYEEQ